jgi:hypothetical protein
MTTDRTQELHRKAVAQEVVDRAAAGLSAAGVFVYRTNLREQVCARHDIAHAVIAASGLCEQLAEAEALLDDLLGVVVADNASSRASDVVFDRLDAYRAKYRTEAQ